ncbi:DUF4377 domain-containing protein [Oceanimonas baumannii]|uniref:Heat-shock protein n=1 Tax=Oceanimonas baumannii TaxID=129578 RepID=A0A235CHA2_9GAMM|nr:DUF4377 domain-containing protein [Oceanimonas baumannii]OYD23893.1 heat-shock protein [Oceanimonas baumannii]TDW58776.1 uncharacterized protein DUF4377 [Oceanimonas baumannii]
MKKSFAVLLTVLLAGCSAGEQQDSMSAGTEVMTVTVGPQQADCVGVGPMKCLVVDGQLFYDRISGFEFEPGYQQTLQIERRQRFTPDNAPADASLYQYRLLQVLGKQKVMP